MSWNYVVDKDGNLEIIVTRWYGQIGQKESHLIASGFIPFEPVQVEVYGEDEAKMIKPLVKEQRR